MLAVDDRLELAEGPGGPAQEGGARGAEAIAARGSASERGRPSPRDDDAEGGSGAPARSRPRSTRARTARAATDRAAGSRPGREPHVEAVDAEAGLADHRGGQPERGARTHRRARPRAPAPGGRRRPLPRGGAGAAPTSRTIDAGAELDVATRAEGREHGDRQDDEREQEELDPHAAPQARGIAERRAAHPAQHDEHDEEHRLGEDRPPVARSTRAARPRSTRRGRGRGPSRRSAPRRATR